MYIAVSPDTLSLSPGSEIILTHQSWEDYEHLLNIRQESSYPKLYFKILTVRLGKKKRKLDKV